MTAMGSVVATGLADQAAEADRRLQQIIGVSLSEASPVDWAPSVILPTLTYGVRDDPITRSSDLEAIFDAIGSDEKSMFWVEGAKSSMGRLYIVPAQSRSRPELVREVHDVTVIQQNNRVWPRRHTRRLGQMTAMMMRQHSHALLVHPSVHHTLDRALHNWVMDAGKHRLNLR